MRIVNNSISFNDSHRMALNSKLELCKRRAVNEAHPVPKAGLNFRDSPWDSWSILVSSDSVDETRIGDCFLAAPSVTLAEELSLERDSEAMVPRIY